MTKEKKNKSEIERYNSILISVGEVSIQLQSSDLDLDNLTKRISDILLELMSKKEKINSKSIG